LGSSLTARNRSFRPATARVPPFNAGGSAWPVMWALSNGHRGRPSCESQRKGLSVYLSGKVYRAFSVKRIPPPWVCGTKELRFKPDPLKRFVHGQAGQPFGGLPGRAAWRPSDHMHVRHGAPMDFHMELRGAKQLPVPSQAHLPGQAASGGRGQNPFHSYLFPRGDQLDRWPRSLRPDEGEDRSRARLAPVAHSGFGMVCQRGLRASTTLSFPMP
jgi:hypothetical protein